MDSEHQDAGQDHRQEMGDLERSAVPGVIAVLGQLGPGAVVTEEGLAKLFQRHASSVKRAIRRGELPPPTRIFGGNAWTVGCLVRHFESRQSDAAKEREREPRRLAELTS